jgi:hypothetical protein
VPLDPSAGAINYWVNAQAPPDNLLISTSANWSVTAE